jgi:hypothetical protein
MLVLKPLPLASAQQMRQQLQVQSSLSIYLHGFALFRQNPALLLNVMILETPRKTVQCINKCYVTRIDMQNAGKRAQIGDIIRHHTH